jgi:ABC-type Fe3+-siderophore transport system permease subunit
VVLIAATREPTEQTAVAGIIAGASLALGAAAALVALWLEERWAPLGRRRMLRAQWIRALRRGALVGALVAALASLRAIGGLTPITGGFVLAGLALAEIVLAARPRGSSG